MDIQYYYEDALKTSERYLFNPCDSHGIFGSKRIKSEYPFSYSQFIALANKAVPLGLPLGTVQLVKCRDRTILNCIVMRDNAPSYDAFAYAFEQIEELLYGKSIGIPYTFGDEWQILKPIIEYKTVTVTPNVYIF